MRIEKKGGFTVEGKAVGCRRTMLAMGLLVALGASTAHAQSTTSSIFGRAQAGDSIAIRSSTGLTRTVSIDSQGRYNAPQLPVGTYSVTVMHDGKEVQRRDNVQLKVGAGVDVSFGNQAGASDAANAKQLAGVSVSANALPPIDVSTVDSRTVVTADQLAKLPLPRTAEAAALLAPGTVNSSIGAAGINGAPLISFGGSSVTENAYYINGFNTTDPMGSNGGITLPYGSIDQEEVYTGGYSAQYGRSDGGVLNMVGKNGTNEWHFGGQYLYEPSALRASQNNTYYANGLPPTPVAGNLYSPNSQNDAWRSTYDVYLGGPLIKDRLFLFASAEMEQREGNTVGNVTTGTNTHYTYKTPKWYTKVNWNITDSNLLEVTGASDIYKTSGTIYNYDYNALRDTSLNGQAQSNQTGGTMWSGKFTSYLTDSLTLTALYGKMTTYLYNQVPGYNPDLAYIMGATNQNPALNGGVPNIGQQTVRYAPTPRANNKTSNLRFSLTYVLGSHTLTAGIDNLRASANGHIKLTSGPGYNWIYGYTSHPNRPLNANLGVPALIGFPNGGSGYYVTKYINADGGNLTSVQNAQFIEDLWQVSDRWLLSLGLRNDGFTNNNKLGQPYMRQTAPQWAPRLGFSWDVNGDGRFKVFGNAGRYNLGSPLSPGGIANGVLRTREYFTYSGIAPDGTPTGLTHVAGPVAGNNFYGQVFDPRTVTVENIKAMSQDEFMAGFAKTAGQNWVYGGKLTLRILRHQIDDDCDTGAVFAKAAALGVVGADATNNASCYYINPGEANTFAIRDSSGVFHDVPMTNAEMRFPRMQRKYYGLEGYLEHPFDGRWYGKVDYTFSRSYGNTEGWGQSSQGGAGGTQNSQWDYPELMVYAGGPQGNDHTHQLKAFGYYQVTPEWLVSANLSLMSGGPKFCYGLYGADPYNTRTNDPDGYGSGYHWCNGRPSAPGAAGRLPWIKQLDLGVHYRPEFAQHKLGFSLDVFNVTNSQVPLGVNSTLYTDTTGTMNPVYGTPLALQPPRYVRLGVTYDY